VFPCSSEISAELAVFYFRDFAVHEGGSFES
jgi:hypothetical protein